MLAVSDSAPSSSAVKPCAIKQVLIDELRVLAADLARAHNDDLEAVISGDISAGELTARKLNELQEVRRLMIERYRSHVVSHGC